MHGAGPTLWPAGKRGGGRSRGREHYYLRNPPTLEEGPMINPLWRAFLSFDNESTIGRYKDSGAALAIWRDITVLHRCDLIAQLIYLAPIGNLGAPPQPPNGPIFRPYRLSFKRDPALASDANLPGRIIRAAQQIPRLGRVVREFRIGSGGTGRRHPSPRTSCEG